MFLGLKLLFLILISPFIIGLFFYGLKKKSESGFKFLYTASKKIKDLTAITLRTNHRNPIVEDLVLLYENSPVTQ